MSGLEKHPLLFDPGDYRQSIWIGNHIPEMYVGQSLGALEKLDREREIISYGKISEVLETLYPQLIGSGASELLDAIINKLNAVCDPLPNWEQETRLVLIGSIGKMVVAGYQPKGWDMPRKLWKEAEEYYPKTITEPKVPLMDTAANSLANHMIDVDIRFRLRSGMSMTQLTSELLDLPIVKSIKGLFYQVPDLRGFSAISLILNDFFKIDLGQLPKTQEEVLNNCRTSLHMSGKDLSCMAGITQDGELYVPIHRYLRLFGGDSSVGLPDADLPQALLTLLLAYQGRFWYPPRHERHTGGGCIWADFSIDEYWHYYVQHSIGREEYLADRQPDIKTRFLLLLTCWPDAFEDMLKYHIFEHLRFGNTATLNTIPKMMQRIPSDYEIKFRNGELEFKESAPFILADIMGIPIKDLSEEFTVVM